MRSLLFSPAGRIDRRTFWKAFVILAVLVLGGNALLRAMPIGVLKFLFALVFPFVIIQMTYSIYGKRLHDFGRSLWPVTGLLFGMFCMAIVMMLIFGGADYFSEFSQYSRNEDIDPEVIKAIQERYQDRLKQGRLPLNLVMWVMIGIFTIWTGLSKSDDRSNRYGSPPETFD